MIILWILSSFLLLLFCFVDKTGCTPQFQSTQKRNDFMPPVTNRQSKSTGQKKFERQPFERPSKVQPSKKQPEFKMQPPKMPSKECSNQYVPTYHIEWDGMCKGNFLLLFPFEILFLRISNVVSSSACLLCIGKNLML